MATNQTFQGDVYVEGWGGGEYSNCVFLNGTKLIGVLEGTIFFNCTMVDVNFSNCWGSPIFRNCTVVNPVKPNRYHDWHAKFENTPPF